MINELALFTGAGGGLLGSKLVGNRRTVCYVEWNAYCVEVLKARIRDGYLDDAPIWDDANSFDGRPWAGSVDLLTAGFPCQPFSNAGLGLEDADPRNGWPATIRIIREVRPRFLQLENVAALLSKRYIGKIFGDLVESGYRFRWDCIPASSIGAPHERDRLWIIATYSNSGNRELSTQSERQEVHPDEPLWDGKAQSMAGSICDSASKGLEDGKPGKMERSKKRYPIMQSQRPSWWKAEPGLGRVADGVADRVERLRALGNGQVPGVVREAWNLLNDEVTRK